MHEVIRSGEVRLSAHLARPADGAGAEPRRGLVLCHGFPAGPQGAETAGESYPDFADHLAREAGWTVLTFNFRGSGESEGQFSLGGWLDDVRAAVDHLSSVDGVGGVWLAGSSTGGALAICETAEDQRVRGVATLAAPADFADWASDARAFLDHAREVGVITDRSFPADFDRWAGELHEIRPVGVIGKIAPRPCLLVHGSDDDVVPPEDARLLADASEGHAELRLVNGAGHRLRHDPRAVAVLLGWLERQTL